MVTRLYDKTGDFNFAIINFPHLHSNVPTSPACGVNYLTIHALRRHYSMYSDFLQRHRILNAKILNQGFAKNCLILSFKKLFFGRYQHLVDMYSVS
jgi:hypothetical protein